jgi:glutamate formiminotransferase/formiminotetrahydrofolate cyclodeaminase
MRRSPTAWRRLASSAAASVRSWAFAVYLYGDAATQPERKIYRLFAKVNTKGGKRKSAGRRGAILTLAQRKPATWGATVIGVRPFLIAYNIYLNSDDIQIADKVARNIRYSSGGLRNVQAKGFLVEGQAQVSMNLTNFAKTPIHRVQELVRREAAYYGLQIRKAELVGLIPQKALLDSAKWYLQLDEMDDSQVLEYTKLAEQEENADNLPHDFLAAVAGNSATPGGGAVAALAAALGAALAEMVAGLTHGRKKYAAVQTEMAAALHKRRRPCASNSPAPSPKIPPPFNELMAIYRDQSLQGEMRANGDPARTIGAALVPLNVARLARDVAQLAQQIAEQGMSTPSPMPQPARLWPAPPSTRPR